MSDKPSTPAGGPAEAAPAVRCAVLTVHDPRAPATALDALGDAVAAQLQRGGCALARRWSVPDDPGRVDDALIDFGRDAGADALFLLGGTGIHRREHALEAAERRMTKPLAGFAHLFYQLAFQALGTSALHLRAAAGVVGAKALYALPADGAACELAIKALVLPELPRLVAAAKAP